MKAWNAGFLRPTKKKGWYPDILKRKSGAKVQNAKKTELDGIKFDSRLESYFYSLLKMHGIPFKLQKEYLLQESFLYNGETVRPMIMSIDFWLPDHNMLVDTKGVKTDTFVIRLKWLKFRLKTEYKTEPLIELPSTKKECDSLILQLLSKTRK